GTTYTQVFYVKPGTATRVQLMFPDAAFGSTQYVNFLLSGSGSVTASAGVASSSITLENGEYILSVTMAATAGATAKAQIVSINSGTAARAVSYTSTETFYVDRVEVLAGSGYGTPIITTSGAGTRNDDALLIKPVPGTYDIDITLSDASVVSLTGITITSSGWTVPTALNRYVTRITGFAP
ncbi:MAG TPA: hypothetical protein VLZ84_11145, partial [Asticcacaulis sp.]|nr:hypothetical protein [Asticcacaulis sp.]